MRAFFRGLKNALTRNLIWKIVSVIFAVVLWLYVISNDASITSTRDITIKGGDINITGLATLDSNDLALKTDITTALSDVVVRVTVPQSSYSRLNSDNVRVELSLSGIRQKGVREVQLSATTSIGRVAEIIPPSIELEFEEKDSRYVTVQVKFENENSDYHYNVVDINPMSVTVKGPASIVQEVAMAEVVCDMTDVTSSMRMTSLYSLLDSSGNTITHGLTRSTSSVMLNIEVHPRKRLSANESALTTGQPADGYRISSIEVQPATVDVYGDESILEGLEWFTVESPLDVTGVTETFSGKARIRAIEGVKFLSGNEVDIIVHVEETSRQKVIDNAPVTLSGTNSQYTYSLDADSVIVLVEGLYTQVNNLTRASDLLVSANVEGLGPGEHNLTLNVTSNDGLPLTLTAEPASVRVTISAK